MYRKIAKPFAEHLTVHRSQDEYVHGDASTNTIEGFFGVFKRGMKRVYQQCLGDDLHRYVAEFAFRYNNRSALEIEDTERTAKALTGIGGKRLTHRTTDKAAQ